MVTLEPLDARVPAWDLGALTVRVCPFCKTNNPSVLTRPDTLPVALCRTCGCWYVAKRPSVEAITKFYDGYYDAYRPAVLSRRQAALMIEETKETARLDWHIQALGRVLGGLRNKHIVEVGCGLCRFLLMARAEGATVAGCDLAPEACAFARDHLGIAVHQQTLNSCSTAVGRADAVVMRDLIEHPVEPLVDIETAYEILKPGGCLLFHTPNGGEAGSSAETARRWVGFRVDLEHLQYLSSRTVHWLSQRFGFVIERLEASGFPCLKGIDKLPSRPSRIHSFPKDAARRIPGMRRMVRGLRAIENEISGSRCDPRLGFYHLFAILRKV